MPTLDFKGKQFIYGHHLTVPVRTLKIDTEKSFNTSLPPEKFSLNDNLIIRISDLETLQSEAAAWQKHRNQNAGPVD